MSAQWCPFVVALIFVLLRGTYPGASVGSIACRSLVCVCLTNEWIVVGEGGEGSNLGWVNRNCALSFLSLHGSDIRLSLAELGSQSDSQRPASCKFFVVGSPRVIIWHTAFLSPKYTLSFFLILALRLSQSISLSSPRRVRQVEKPSFVDCSGTSRMEDATGFLGIVKQWYTEQPFGYYALTILAVAWISFIVKQLVSSSRSSVNILRNSCLGTPQNLLLFFTFSRGSEAWLSTAWTHTRSSPKPEQKSPSYTNSG